MSYDSKEVRCPDCNETTVIEPHDMNCTECGYDIAEHDKDYANRRRTIKQKVREIVSEYESFELRSTNPSQGCIRVNLTADGAMFMDMDSVSNGGEIDETIFDRQTELQDLKDEILEVDGTTSIEQWDSQRNPDMGSKFGVTVDMTYSTPEDVVLLVGTRYRK